MRLGLSLTDGRPACDKLVALFLSQPEGLIQSSTGLPIPSQSSLNTLILEQGWVWILQHSTSGLGPYAACYILSPAADWECSRLKSGFCSALLVNYHAGDRVWLLLPGWLLEA